MTDVSYYLSLPYTRVLRQDEDGGVVATIAELDGCMADGSNESEALQNLREAQAAWLEAAIATGQDVPLPETEDDLPSGKFVVRLPRSLHQRLNKLAKKDDASLNQVMVVAAAEYAARREARAEAKSAPSATAWRLKMTKWDRPAQGVAPRNVGDFLQLVTDRGQLSRSESEPHLHRPAKARRG